MSKAMTKKIFYGWWVVIACSIITVYVGGVVFSGFTAFFEPIRQEFGWSRTQISLAASLRGLEMGIFAPFVGYLADRFGVRILIFIGSITIGSGLILLSFTQSLALFYGSFLIIAFGAGGCAAVVLTTAVVNWFQKRVSVALGIMGSGLGLGGLMIPIIVWLIEAYQWRTTLLILGFGMWILGIPLSLIIRNRPEQYGYLPDGEPSQDPITPIHIRGEGVELGFKKVLKEKSFLYLNITEVIRFMAFAAMSIHIMPYLDSIGMPRHTAGLVAAAIPLFTIVGRFFFGYLGDIYDKRILLAMGYCLMSLGLLVFCYVQVRWLIFPLLFIFSPGLGGIMVLRAAILQEYYGRDSFGKILGIIMGAGSIGGIIGPTLAGWVYDSLGSYYPVWFFYFIITGMSTGLILRVK
jgi:MFS family permease